MDPVDTYLREVQGIRAMGAGVRETSYYPPLANLLNDVGRGLKPRVHCIINVRNQGAGIPDGGFFTPDQKRVVGDDPFGQGPTPARGVLEVKGAGDDLDEIIHSEQVRRYWELYRQVLVTNLWDFALVGEDAAGEFSVLERFRLAQDEKRFWEAAPQDLAEVKGQEFVEYLRRVMLNAASLNSPIDVAWFLASYARDAKARVERADVPSLRHLRMSLEQALGLQFEDEEGERFFRSTLVQTLFYGVFAAWVLWCRKEPAGSKANFNWHDAAFELRVPMIRSLFGQLATADRLEPLGLIEVLDWTAAALNRVDRAAFFDAFEQDHAVQHFYEPFLEAFDPDLRKQLGVWYTPPEIVRYMVERVDTALREELNLPDGLADPSVYVLDPCTGTGSYLVEVLRRIEQTLEERGDDALIAHALKQAAMNRVFGFELLPAPFVVAHLQLGLLLQQFGAPLDRNERAGVYLSNALTGWEPTYAPKQKFLGFPELEVERDAAQVVKQERRILVVLGNPPYNAFAGVSPDEEEGLVDVYKDGLNTPQKQGGWGIKKFNLDDLYIRFFRMAERRIAEQTGVGIVAYISNFSYLTDSSFVVMRQHLLNEFDALWFDSLNGDSRETGKLTPEGKPDPSVFSTAYNREGIRVGTAISMMVRKPERSEEPTVRYREFWGANKRAALLDSLEAADFDASYLTAQPTAANRFMFRPVKVSPGYLTWPKITEFSAESASNGLMEKRGGALIDIDRDALEQRMRMYFDDAVSWDNLIGLGSGLTKDAARFNAEQTRVKVTKAEDFEEQRLQRYLFRPFDVRWSYYSPVRPLWNEPRPKLWKQHQNGTGFIVTRLNAANADEGVPFTFTRLLLDDHLLAPDASGFPILLGKGDGPRRGPGTGQTDFFSLDTANNDAPVANLSAQVRAYLAALGIADPDRDAETAALVWMHALAIGFSPLYLSENAAGVRQDWPRIPLPTTLDALRCSAAIGEQIALLLDTEAAVPGVTSGQIRPELRPIGLVSSTSGAALNPDTGDLALKARWGYAGRSGETMPGPGELVNRPYATEEAMAITDGAPDLGMSGDEAVAALGEATCDIYLNDRAYWRNLPSNVWDFRMGGYQVLKKWLSYREIDLIKRPLTAGETGEFRDIARRLAALRLLEPALDENYQRVKSAAYEWSGTGQVGLVWAGASVAAP